MTKQEIIAQVKIACGTSVDVAYCLGIIEHESGFVPDRRSDPKASDEAHGGAWGLAQFLPGTAAGLGYTGTPEGLFDPKVNIDLLVKYTTQNMQRFGVRDSANLASCHNSGVPLTRLKPGSKRLYDVETYVAAVLPLIVKWRRVL